MQSGIRKTLVALAAVVLLAVLTGGFYLWSIDRQYDKARNQADVVKSHFEFEGSGPSLDQLPQITGDLSRLEEDLRELDRRVERPLIGSLVKSAPIVGEQVRESQELLDLGIELTSISRESSEIANQMKEALETNGFMGDEPLVGPTWLDVVNEHWDKIYELEARFDAALDELKGMTEQKIEGDPVKVIELTSKKFGLNEGERSSILRHLIEGGDLTRYGLYAAFTRASQ